MVGISAIIKYCGATKQWYGGILALPCIAVDNTDVNKEDGKLGTGTYMEITILLFEKKKIRCLVYTNKCFRKRKMAPSTQQW
jgi:hypothetical protein